MDKFVGKRLDGRYEIHEIIGVGGMAVVYKAFDTIENRIVAIKILKEEFVSNEDFVRRFKNESKAIAVLQHPNIVKVYDVSFGDLIQYIVMEYIEGITLKEYIEENGNIPWKSAVGIVMQILRALQHAHDKGIIHRDVKPQNIIVTTDGTIKVTDFGIARFARSEHKTITDKAIGSVHYISPEQARGDITDEKADIYSVGVILYEMLSGTLPFKAESAVVVAMMQLQNDARPLREIDPTIPLGLAQITMNAMQKEVARRYQTAAEMLCDLETFRRDPTSTFERSYYVDDAPTKYVPAEEKNDNDDLDDEKDKKGKSWVPIVTGVMVGVAVLVAIFLVVFIFNKFNSSSEAKECPNFVGKTVDQIKEEYGEDQFSFETIYEETNTYTVGEVIRQTPAPGTKIKKRNEIKLTIATSEALITVPDIANDTESLAKQTLKGAGFSEITIEQKYDDTVNEGKAIGTSPSSGSQIRGDAPITIYISKGKEIHYVEVPNLMGYDIDSVKRMLEDNKLKLGTVTKKVSSGPKGYVISQTVESGTQVTEGTTVSVEVSDGNDSADPSEQEYSMPITVNIPEDCSFKEGYIVADLESGNHYQSDKLKFGSGKSYTFTVSSKDSMDTIIVKIWDSDQTYEYKYQKLKVNFKKQSYEVLTEYNEYPKS